MSGGELRLVIFVAIPIEAKPAHAVEDRLDRRLGGASAIRVLDAEQELAAAMAGEQPVEQGGAGAADMQEASRRGREAGDDLAGFLIGRGRAGFGWGCAQAPSLHNMGPWRPVTRAPLAWRGGSAKGGGAGG
jgi:hypothetical protein